MQDIHSIAEVIVAGKPLVLEYGTLVVNWGDCPHESRGTEWPDHWGGSIATVTALEVPDPMPTMVITTDTGCRVSGHVRLIASHRHFAAFVGLGLPHGWSDLLKVRGLATDGVKSA